MKVLGISLVLALSAGCHKETRAAPAADDRAYGPAVLRMVTCPPNKPERPSVESGCESCKDDELCKVFSIRGRAVGQCAKNSCRGDADCPGALCTCGAPNECTAGNCRGPEDCGGRECTDNRGRHGHGGGQYCRTKNDTCKTHDDCKKGDECSWAGTSWKCRKETPPPPPG
jgi:hypothetical protein